MDVVVGGAVASSLAAGGVVYLIRPWFKVSVNCHFCNTNAKVPYNARNSWICGECEQYNGFNEEGDYNRQIHEASSTSFTRPGGRSKKQADNGLCKSCNLNQDLKISQLASYSGEGTGLEEYRDHLERVYRLCGLCEDVVASRLRDQDAQLTPFIIQHKLETSRLLNKSQHSSASRQPLPFLVDIQFLASVLLFLLILSPDTTGMDLSLLPAYLQTILASIRYSYNVNLHVLQYTCALTIALVSLPLLRTRPISLFCFLPLFASWLEATEILRLSLACLSGAVVMFGSRYQGMPHSPRKSLRTTRDTISAKFIELSDTESDSGLASNISSQASTNQKIKPVSAEPKRNKNNNFMNSVRGGELLESVGNLFSPARMSSPLLRSGDANSLNHEFAIDNSASPAVGGEKDCDIASLCLGEEEPERPASVASNASQSPFTPQLYSPENKSGIKFSSKSILRPSRLTSWVAGGYWTPPTDKPAETVSRASSHSSGFISGPASMMNYPTSAPPQQMPFNSLALNQSLPVNFLSMPNSPANSFIGDDRFSLLSEPVQKAQLRSPGSTSVYGTAATFEPSSYSAFHQIDRSPTFTQIRPKMKSRRSTRDEDDLSDASSAAAERSAARKPAKQKSFNEKFSLNITFSLNEEKKTVTISPLGVLVTLSVVANCVALYCNISH